MKSFFIVTPNIKSKFAKTLQNKLKEYIPSKVLRTTKQRPLGRSFAITNNPFNKIEQFKRFTSSSVVCPRFCTSADAVPTLGVKTVFARTLVNSTNGNGLALSHRCTQLISLKKQNIESTS